MQIAGEQNLQAMHQAHSKVDEEKDFAGGMRLKDFIGEATAGGCQ